MATNGDTRRKIARGERLKMTVGTTISFGPHESVVVLNVNELEEKKAEALDVIQEVPEDEGKSI